MADSENDTQQQNNTPNLFNGSFFGNRPPASTPRTYNIPVDKLTGIGVSSNKFVDNSAELARNQSQQNQIQLNSLQEQIVLLRKGLANIAVLLQKDAESENIILRDQAERENKLFQDRIRTDREQGLENIIQPQVLRRVNSGQAQITGLFERISKGIQWLLAGIFTTQLVRWFTGEQEGNKEKSDKAKNSLIRTTGFIIAGLVVVKGGLFLVKLAVKALISKVVGLLFSGVRLVLLTAINIGKNLIKGIFGTLKGGIKSVVPSVKGATSAAATTGAAKGAAGAAKGAAAGGGGLWQALGKGGAKTLGKGLGKIIPGLNIAVNAYSMSENIKEGNYLRATLNAIGMVFPVAGLAELGLGLAQDSMKQPATPQQKTETESSAPNVLDNFKFDMPEMSFDQTLIENSPLNDMRSLVQTENFNIDNPDILNYNPEEEEMKSEVLPSNNIMPTNFKLSSRDSDQMKESQEKIWQQVRSGNVNMMYDSSKLMMNNEYTIKNENIAPSPFSPENIQKVGPLKESSPKVMIATAKPEPELSPQSNAYTTDVPLISSSNPDNMYISFSKVTYNVVV